MIKSKGWCTKKLSSRHLTQWFPTINVPNLQTLRICLSTPNPTPNTNTHIHTITKALDIELLQKVRMENVLPFQIRKMFDKADKDGDGKLTKDEWFNVLNSSGCETSMQVSSCQVDSHYVTYLTHNTMHLRAEVSEFFDRMDRDFDGRLSFGEFMGEETPLEKVFKNMDKDGDGTVSKEVRGMNQY